MAKKKTEEQESAAEVAETTAEEISDVAGDVEAAAVEAAPAEEKPKKTRAKKTEAVEEVEAGAPAGLAPKGKRAEKIGVVTSDKMTKTVVVRVDRVVKHPIYRKYVKKRKKFMAHDEQGAKIGDKVRIVETRPMSARKRWRVVEIIQKAEL